MKAISIRQPWASLIVHHGKDIENRDWASKHRGPLLIHAAATRKADEWWAAIELCNRIGIKFAELGLKPSSVPMGGIIGMANMVGCVERSGSPWFVGRFGFELADVKPLPFMALKGQLGLFEVAYQMPEGDQLVAR